MGYHWADTHNPDQPACQLAPHFEVSGLVQTDVSYIDSSMQWSQAKNVWHNAIIRTFFNKLAAPFRWLARLFER
jgi:hypothetical protein